MIADIWKLLWTFKPTNYAGMSLIWQRSKYKTITNTRVYQQERGGLHLSLSAQKSWSRFYWLDELPVRTAGETGAVVEILPQSLSAFYFVAFLSRAKLPFSSCLSSRSADERPRLGAAEWLRRNVKRPWSCDGWIFFGGGRERGLWEEASPWQSPCTAERVLHSEQSASFDLAWRDTQGQSLHLEHNCSLIRTPHGLMPTVNFAQFSRGLVASAQTQVQENSAVTVKYNAVFYFIIDTIH